MRSGLPACLMLLFVSLPIAGLAGELDRSPVDLVLAPDGSWLVTANQTSHSASLVRTSDGRVLDEIQVGPHPTAMAVTPDGSGVLISCRDDGTVRILSVHDDKLSQLASITVGFHPYGLAVTSDGRRAFVALSASHQVAELDLVNQTVTGKITTGREPRYLALSPDDSRLAVGTSGDRGVTVVDTSARETVYQDRFVGLNIGHMQVSRDGQYAYFPWMVYRHNPINEANIRLGWVLASRIGRIRLDTKARREAISLDPRGRAIADPHGLDLTSDESLMIVSGSSTHELLVYQVPGLPWKDYGGTDHIDPRLLSDQDRFFRIELGGRPMGLEVAADDRTVYVANYLDNSVQVVDLAERRLVGRIFLGGPAEPSLARQGEAIFFDARRSLDQWYSCHTCHYEGGSNSEPMDTWNDETAFTFKTVIPLHNLPDTGPWTWHGWQTSLTDAMIKSMTSTMQGNAPSEADVQALLAYFDQLQPPPNPFREPDGSLSPAARRGKIVFESEQAACIQCHSGTLFTDGQIHDVGLGSSKDRYPGFNTPSLIGVYRRSRLLHNGAVESLEQLLSDPHSPEKVSGTEALNKQDLADLVEYLKSL
jgi:DNA-binding beta-propeller fold protein YncE